MLPCSRCNRPRRWVTVNRIAVNNTVEFPEGYLDIVAGGVPELTGPSVGQKRVDRCLHTHRFRLVITCIETGVQNGLVMIASQGLTRRFGDLVAVDRLTLQVPAGAICVLMGPNGAGKSTTLKMLTGMLLPSSGTASVCGLDIIRESKAVKQRIGVLPENLGLFDELTVYEHLCLTGDVYGLGADVVQAKIDQFLEVLDFAKARNTLARNCSHGTRKKTAFAMALLPTPNVLFLDEPFEAIDPESSRVMQQLIAGAARMGATVLLTSHVFSTVERIGHQFVVLRSGTIALNASREELTKPLEDIYFSVTDSMKTNDFTWHGPERF